MVRRAGSRSADDARRLRRQEQAKALADSLEVSVNGEDGEAVLAALARLLVALLKGQEGGSRAA